jgi:hypothetical protein
VLDGRIAVEGTFWGGQPVACVIHVAVEGIHGPSVHA